MSDLFSTPCPDCGAEGYPRGHSGCPAITAGRALARNDDPETSHEAADGLSGTERLRKLKLLALNTLRLHPKTTAMELAVMTGLDRSSIGPRLATLKHEGWLASGEKRPCKITGKTALVWWVIK